MNAQPAARTKVRLLTLMAGAALLATGGCGTVSTAAKEPAAKAVQLQVAPARFSSAKQLPGDQVTLSLRVKNTGTNPVDHLVVTLSGNEPNQLAVRNVDDNPNDIPQGTNDLPDSVARAAWFIDDGPQHAPLAGGDTWDAGALAPGATTTVKWSMAAITPGAHTLRYYVAGGLTDNAVKATSGEGLTGTVSATIAKP